MTAIKEAGTYLQAFGDIHEYKISDSYNFNKEEGIQANPDVPIDELAKAVLQIVNQMMGK